MPFLFSEIIHIMLHHIHPSSRWLCNCAGVRFLAHYCLSWKSFLLLILIRFHLICRHFNDVDASCYHIVVIWLPLKCFYHWRNGKEIKQHCLKLLFCLNSEMKPSSDPESVFIQFKEFCNRFWEWWRSSVSRKLLTIEFINTWDSLFDFSKTSSYPRVDLRI